MDIGLFGGSFNPPHTGHLWLANEFRVKGKLDMIWVLVSPEPPHKELSELVAYEHRLEMTRLTFQHTFGIELNMIEEDLRKPVYTFQTVEALKAKHPGSTFWLCIGEDSLHDLPRWMEPDRLLRNVNLLVARRGDFVPPSHRLPEQWLQKIMYVDITPITTSSTQIRNLVADKKTIEGLVTPEVQKYIDEHRLYRY
jgi:nicotinate-nucleotide adenylyltransferase